MQMSNIYDVWSNEIKGKINSRFNDVQKLYKEDLRHCTGYKPSPRDEKYSIFGFAVKKIYLHHLESIFITLSL